MTYTLQKKSEVLNFAKALKFSSSKVFFFFFFFVRSVFSVKMKQNYKIEMGCGEVSADRDCILNKPEVQIAS